MAALRLIDALPDFSPLGREVSATRSVAPPEPPQPLPEQPDITEIVRIEVAVAEEALRIKLEAEHAAAIEAEQAAHRQELAAQMENLGREAAAAIEARLGELEQALAARLSGEVARILGGLLTEDLQKRSVEELAARILEAVRDSETIRIEIRGPQSMFAGLSAVLGERIVNLDYIESDGFDLTATIDGTIIETRLSQWSEALSGILG